MSRAGLASRRSIVVSASITPVASNARFLLPSLNPTEHAGVGQLANCEVSSLETSTYEPRCCRDRHDGR